MPRLSSSAFPTDKTAFRQRLRIRVAAVFLHMILEGLERAEAHFCALSGQPARLPFIRTSGALLPADRFTVGVHGAKILLFQRFSLRARWPHLERLQMGQPPLVVVAPQPMSSAAGG